MNSPRTLFEQIGGRAYLVIVAKQFYDKVYSHPWLKHYFKNTRQEVIESQQVDFMSGALGGPRTYSGRMPLDAHVHIHITRELFDVREKLLLETLTECSAPPELVDRWIKIEQAFKTQIVKKSLSECKKRWTTDEILDFPVPNDAAKPVSKAS